MKLTFTLFFFSLFIVAVQSQEIVVVDDVDVGNGATTWTSDKEYHLDGYVFVESGGVLTIEAGTVVKGINSPSTGDQSSALIIARGARINAVGSADQPIIFTAELDDVTDGTDLTKEDKGLWGGLVILGSATVGVDGGVQNIEGIPSTEGRAEYGGSNEADNSGTLKYVSIRHGGSKLEANNEINGLTLGGVGSETIIDYVEVFANLDDGIEWFGGTVNVKHVAVSFCGDDSFDYDQSWNGLGQFWFTIQDNLSNRAGEWDGSEAADLGPKVSPILSNCTFIGAGMFSDNEDNNDALRIREDAAVHLYNSVFTGFARDAIRIDNDNPGADSYDRFLAGDISFTNNIFFDFGSGSTFNEIADVDGGDQSLIINHLNERNNAIDDPGIGGISRQPNGGLDPRVDASGVAWNGAVALEDPFFDDVSYRGAFGNAENWADRWTALASMGFFGSLVSSVDDPQLGSVDEKMKIYPNPVRDEFTIDFELDSDIKLGVKLFDISGQEIMTIRTPENYYRGIHSVTANLSQLKSGIYIAAMVSQDGVIGRRILIKE